MTEPDQPDVEVRLQRDHHDPSGLGATVDAGTWVPGWMRRRDWHRRDDGRWDVLVLYSVTHAGRAFDYLATFHQDDVRGVLPRRRGRGAVASRRSDASQPEWFFDDALSRWRWEWAIS